MCAVGSRASERCNPLHLGIFSFLLLLLLSLLRVLLRVFGGAAEGLALGGGHGLWDRTSGSGWCGWFCVGGCVGGCGSSNVKEASSKVWQ